MANPPHSGHRRGWACRRDRAHGHRTLLKQGARHRKAAKPKEFYGIVTVIWFDGTLSTPLESTDFTT
jgi:hypothetical protein